MKYIVTGGAGFIGSELSTRLINEGHEVIILDNLATGNPDHIHPDAKLITVDLSLPLPYTVRGQIENADGLFHLAAFTKVEESLHNPEIVHKNNITACFNTLELCRKGNIKNFILSSTSAVYGNAKKFPTIESESYKPMSPYALSKMVCEHYVGLYSALYKLKSVSLRYSNVYGDNQPTEGAYCNVMGIFAKQKQLGMPLTIVGDGKQQRDYIHVNDVVEANILAMTVETGSNSEVFNIGSSVSHSVNEIAKMFVSETVTVSPRIEPKKTLLDCKKANSKLDWYCSITLKDWVKEYKGKLGIDEESKRARKKSKQS